MWGGGGAVAGAADVVVVAFEQWDCGAFSVYIVCLNGCF